jgi:large subunit ribosomal protein L19e
MDMASQKRIAARIMKCGVSRVRIKPSEEVEEALTREDIRGLIQKGLVWSVQKRGTSKFASKKKLGQKRKGRMRGPGRRKGTRGARKSDKTKWIEKVRPLRRLLSELREGGQISRQDYGVLYRRVKGGFFRNRNHLLYYLKEHDILKSSRKGTRPARKKTASKKPSAKGSPSGKARAAVKRPGKKASGRKEFRKSGKAAAARKVKK